MDRPEIFFTVFAFLFQIVLIIHFSLRKWNFNTAIRYGRVVYALSIFAAALSVYLWQQGKPWTLWIGGFLFLAWGIFGFIVDYMLKLQWRNPPHWPVLLPYVLLFLATMMFYWWPLAILWKPMWYGYAFLFVISTWLNVTSHRPA